MVGIFYHRDTKDTKRLYWINPG